MKKGLNLRRAAGFTLVEMLVSMAILAIILVVLAQVTGALQKSVTQTTSAVHEFEGARDAFESMTRRISQATLNSYNDTATGTSLSVPGYTRASELRFISGPASVTSPTPSLAQTNGPLFAGTNPYHPTHAIFFNAPLGVTSGNSNQAYVNLVQLMNTVGYYIEWNTDTGVTSTGLSIVPSFITGYLPRWRYRLMEMVEPSDNLTIYTDTSGQQSGVQASKSWFYNQFDWFQTPYNHSTIPGDNDYQCARPIADNVMLLEFLPMVPPQNAQYPEADGTSTDLMNPPTGASGYLYDTAPLQGSGTPPISQNQLPPMVYVLMIAVDEKSFSTYVARKFGPIRSTTIISAPTALGIDSPSSNTTFLTNSSYTQRQNDITQVTNALIQNHIRYRVFSSAVPLTSH